MTTAIRGTEARPSEPVERRLRPFPALDGLRGLALAAVVFFHYPTHNWVPGGAFGVGVFFVLSGFLITGGLLDEAARTATISIGNFLKRRGWRLLPALIVLLAAFLLLAALVGHGSWFTSSPLGDYTGHPLPFRRALKGALAAISYSYNVLLAHGSPAPAPLGHLWTLAIEVQFYVGWVLVLRWVVCHRPRLLLPLTLAVAAGSACTPWFVWHGGAGAKVVYFGTIPRLQQFLAGALVAQLWRRGCVDRIPRRALRSAAVAAAVTLVVMCLFVGEVTFKYLGGETLAAVAAAAVVAFLLAEPGGSCSNLLGRRPLTWLGQRSYAIYLWHWPLGEWTNRLPHPVGVPTAIGASLVLAEASWRLVEQPAQRLARS